VTSGSSLVDVRVPDASEREALLQLLRGTGQFGDEEVSVAAELFDLGCGPAPRDPSYRWLAIYSGESLAGVACYGETPGTDRTFDLYWIAVQSGSQGGGFGTRLLQEVERRITESGGRILVAETSSRSDYLAARSFYVARGYTEAARISDFFAPGDDRVAFTRRLDASSA
jgi:ribosomal protein S18 acetylase RimI-like enzyme